MSVILDAIKAAGDKGNDRDEVLKQIFATNRPDSVLGKYSIDKNGDTTLTDYGVYKVAGGKLVFQRTVEAQK
jgi:branched-chain amino acid transport system substrate-binding protein